MKRPFSLPTLFAMLALPVMPALAQDSADMFVRMQRLEQQVRQMSGQIEQLQHQNRRLDDELQRFRKDTDLRFDDLGGSKSSAPAQGGAAARPAAPRRNDAFDPAASPNAPGAPRALGATPPTAPLPAQKRSDAGSSLPLQVDGQATPAQPARIGPSVAAATSGNAKADFDLAQEMMKRGEYANAEMAFRQFLQAHPKSGLVPEATFQLGETYNQRSQYREAAEHYLKVSTSWPQSSRAATAMLRLGVALQALGAKEQACSTLREVDKRYPNASASVKRGVERELQRARCEA